MSSGIAIRRLLLATSATLLLQAVPAAAQDAPKNDKVIGSVTVTDTAIDATESESSYKITRSTSATRTDTPLIDVPQAINVVGIKEMQDRAVTSIGEAVLYVPGVAASQGESNRDTLAFRGNTTTASFFVDGVRDDIQTYRDLYNTERLEVFKGPNALAFGRGTAGGLINRVTKVADGQNHANINLEAGSFSHLRGVVDLGAPAGDTVSFRLTGVWQDSDSYRDGDYFKRWGVNPTVTLAPDDATKITLGYEHFKDRRVGDRGITSYLNRPLDVPRGAFFGDPDASPTYTNTDALNLYAEHQFSDAVTLRSRTRYAEYDKFYQNVFPGAVPGVTTANPTGNTVNPAGLPAGTYGPGTIFAISAYNNAAKRKNFFNQTDLNAEVMTGAIKHTLLLGVEAGHQTTRNRRFEGFFPTATAPTGVQTIYALISSPRIRRPDIQWRQTATSGDNYAVANVIAGYAQDQIELSPMFQIIAGVRYEHYRTQVTNLNPFLAPTAQRFFDVTNNLWSPRAGVVFKPVESASLYASWSRSWLPRGGDQLAGLNVSNQSLAPEKFDNYEVGAKWDIVPSFNLSAALYRLDRSNVLVLSDPNNAASATIPVGTQRINGFELSAQGEITKQLSVSAAYTYSDATFLNSVSGTVKAGNRVANLPKNAVAVWTRFDPIERLGVGLGVIHNGQRYAATDNTVSLPGYTRVDGAVYFKLSDRFDLQANVENLFNKKYILYSDNNTNLTPGSPTAFKVGLNAKF